MNTKLMIRDTKFSEVPEIQQLTEANDPKNIRQKYPTAVAMVVGQGSHFKAASMTDLSTPGNKLAVCFVAGAGFQKHLGINSGCDMIAIDSQYYRRITPRDIGLDRQAGLRTIRNKMTILYAVPVAIPDPKLKEELDTLVHEEAFSRANKMA